MIRLFALDMDGTLLQPDHRTVAEEDRKAILDAVAAGAYFVPATGRMASFLPPPVQELDCWQYAITSNGAAVVERASKKVLHGAYLDAGMLSEILDGLSAYEPFFELYADGQSFIERKRLEDPERYHIPLHSVEFFRNKGTLIESAQDFLKEGHHLEKIYLPYLRPEIQAPLKVYLQSFPVLVTSSVGDNLEVNAKNATKGDALRFLQEYLGLQREELLAMGDQDNDLSMIRYAGVGVAMGNALELVRQEADYVTKTNAECGVCHALRRFVCR